MRGRTVRVADELNADERNNEVSRAEKPHRLSWLRVNMCTGAAGGGEAFGPGVELACAWFTGAESWCGGLRGSFVGLLAAACGVSVFGEVREKREELLGLADEKPVSSERL